MRRATNVGVPFHRIPQQVTRHGHIWSVGEERCQIALHHRNPAKLQRVVRYRLSIAFRVIAGFAVGIDTLIVAPLSRAWRKSMLQRNAAPRHFVPAVARNHRTAARFAA
jgi:hypothetical protein